MKNCDICKRRLKYNEKWDAFFCPHCNEWKERKCSDELWIWCDIPIDYELALKTKDFEKEPTLEGYKNFYLKE